MSNQENDINAVRLALFETLRALSDKNNPMEIERAKAICQTSQVIINTAKIEVDFVRATGLKLNSSFIPVEENKPLKLSSPLPIKSNVKKETIDSPGISYPKPGVTVHKIR